MQKRVVMKVFFICLLIIVIWTAFLRDPIMFGERNAGKLEERDKARSEMVFNDMPSDMKKAVEISLTEKYQEHLIFLKAGDDYYAMIDVSGTLYRINEEDFSLTELFSVKRYACDFTVKEGCLYFLTGIRESRDKRSLSARLLHSRQIVVLTDVEKWAYSFKTGQIEGD